MNDLVKFLWGLFVTAGAIAGFVSFYGVGKLYEYVYALTEQSDILTDKLNELITYLAENPFF